MNIESINFELPNLKLPVIIIIGPPGAGKTVVGRQLAKVLNWDFYDTDTLIEQATSMKVTEIFSQHNEIVFRQLENILVNKITEIHQKFHEIAQSGTGTIISCGGGLPVPLENFANLEKLGEIICLQAPASLLLERISQIKNRPLLNSNLIEGKDISHPPSEPLSRLEALLSERKETYAKAKHQINTNNQSVEEIVITIKTLLKL